MNRSICVSFFTEETKNMFIKSTQRFLGHNKRVCAYKAGDLVILYNYEKKEVFGICILRSITSDGCIYRETHLIDQDLYTDEYRQYSKYEVGVKTYLIEPTALKEIYRECDIEEGSKLAIQYTSFKKPSCDLGKWTRRVLLERIIEEESS